MNERNKLKEFAVVFAILFIPTIPLLILGANGIAEFWMVIVVIGYIFYKLFGEEKNGKDGKG